MMIRAHSECFGQLLYSILQQLKKIITADGHAHVAQRTMQLGSMCPCHLAVDTSAFIHA